MNRRLLRGVLAVSLLIASVVFAGPPPARLHVMIFDHPPSAPALDPDRFNTTYIPMAPNKNAVARKIASGTPTVLLIALNNNPEEIDALKKASAARGEKLVIVPTEKEVRELYPIYAPLDRKLNPLKHEMQLLDNEKTVPGSKREQYVIDRLETVIEQSAELQEKFDDLPKPFTLARVDEALQQIEADGGTLSAVAISGHHSEHYFGDNGEFWTGDFRALLQKHPALLSGVTLYMALGCYTATPAEVLLWQTVFPSVKIIAGFIGQGPSGEVDSGKTFFADLMALQSSLTSINEKTISAAATKIRKKLLTIPKLDELDYGVSVQTQSSEPVYVTATFRGSLAQATGGCEANLRKILAFSTDLKGYWKGLVPLPDRTDSSPLRSFYTLVQNSVHCLDQLGENQLSAFPGQRISIPVLIALIHERNVGANILHHYAAQLAQVKEIIVEYAATIDTPVNPDELIPTQLDLSRADLRKTVIAKNNALDAFIKPPASPTPEQSDLRTKLAKARVALKSLLIDLDPAYVSASWLELGRDGKPDVDAFADFLK